MNYRTRIIAATLVLAAGTATVAGARDFDKTWPKEIKEKKAKILVYQPQLETFDDNRLTARSAVSVTMKDAAPVFGAVWFDARIEVDRDDREVKLKETKVTDVKFPTASPEGLAELRKVIEDEVPKWGDKLNYDELVALMTAVDQEKMTSEQLNNAPPEIIYKNVPSILVLIDGKPIAQDVPDSPVKRVINTPFFIVEQGSTWYLKGAETWYDSKDVLGPYEKSRNKPSKTVVDMADKMVAKPPEDAPKSDKKVIPEVVVRTAPAELIQTEGDPDYQPVEGTTLLFVKDSDTNIIMDTGTQMHFILIAGRWYASKTLEGPWKYVNGFDLPADFAKIPADSPLGEEVLASIPGTQAAREALLENQIPTTAEVDRKTATVTVTYDGEPQFKAIEGTSMSYAINTDKSVLLIDNKYYCCDQAIWFESDSPNGPWAVSTATPPNIASLPPDVPVYNVKYVQVYEETPDVVYVGYTPAYTGSYIYNGCVVYGTGYYYQPWYGAYYYPRPVTFGFSVHYSPYGGWGMSFGMSYGWFSMSVGGYGHPGYWGAGGYHAGYHHGYRHGFGAGYVAGSRNGNRVSHHGGNNIYKNRGEGGGVRNTAGRPSQQPAGGRGGAARPSQQPAGGRGGAARPSTQPNNVYADKNGNVHRNNNGQWEQRGKDGWEKSGNRPSNNDLNRDYQSRERSQQRQQSYSRSQSRPSGRSGGGGGRRR